MSIFKKNNSEKVIASYGKTEPVSDAFVAVQGNGFKTEPVNHGSYGSGGNTVPVNNPFVDVPDVEKPIDHYGVTEPANPIITVDPNTGVRERIQPVVGWLVCIKGANIGREYRIHSDNNYVGRATGDIIITGDDKISREHHMVVIYDPEERTFSVRPDSGGHIVRLNDKRISGEEPLNNYDIIRTGDTSLMFIAFCGQQFVWEDVNNDRS